MNASINFIPGLEAILGASRILCDPASCSRYSIDEIIPSAIARPSTPEEVAEIVRFVALEKLALIPCGARTKLRLGAPPDRYDIALDTTALNHIVHYDPGDLTLSAEAGTLIAKLNASLFDHQQFLPLLVPWYSLTTIGGTIASGIDSPLRQFYGTARDFLIGAEFVDGIGNLCKSGGRVVKNVTGYDLHKLLIGSLGTLAVITRLNFRTFPAPPAGSLGFVASFPNPEAAFTMRRAITQSPLTPLTLDLLFLFPNMARFFFWQAPPTPEVAVFAGENPGSTPNTLPDIPDGLFPMHEWQLCAAFAGTPEALARYTRDLTRLATESHATSISFLDDTSRPAVWGRLRETLSMLIEFCPNATIFKLSVLPTQFSALFTSLRQIAESAGFSPALLVRAGGTIYFALLPASSSDDTTRRLAQSASQIFQLVSGAGGDTRFLFGPARLRALFKTAATTRPDADLMRRLKAAFDPDNIFAPGCLSHHR